VVNPIMPRTASGKILRRELAENQKAASAMR
jgi:acyl-coenzyme A synthetase/AMP-(fatty) acid ligase